MNPRRLQFAGVCFLAAGLLSLVSTLRSGRGSFLIFGCAFLVIGAAFIARSRKVPAA